MKKIVIVDGGPRKNMNTAQLLQRFADLISIHILLLYRKDSDNSLYYL